MLAAIGVEAPSPSDAAARLQATCRVIESRMDDFAVARGGLETDRVSAFEDNHLISNQRQRPGRGKAPDTRPDHHAFNLVHSVPSQKTAPYMGRIPHDLAYEVNFFCCYTDTF